MEEAINIPAKGRASPKPKKQAPVKRSLATISKVIERDGHKIAVYSNGMERDLDRGRLVRPPTSALITTENSNEFYLARVEKKREAALRGANEAIRSGVIGWEHAQDYDFIEVLTESQMNLALEQNAYSTKAAEFVVRMTGNDEQPTTSQRAPDAIGDLAAVLVPLVQLLRDTIRADKVQLHDTIEGEIQ